MLKIRSKKIQFCGYLLEISAKSYAIVGRLTNNLKNYIMKAVGQATNSGVEIKFCSFLLENKSKRVLICGNAICNLKTETGLKSYYSPVKIYDLKKSS